MRGLYLGPKKGGLKYQITILVDRVVLAENHEVTQHMAAREAKIVCQRGAKIAATQAATIDAGGAHWGEELCIISTMYHTGGGFREKVAKFVLRAGNAILASGKTDLSEHVSAADLIETSSCVAVELTRKVPTRTFGHSKEKTFCGTLYLRISSRWLKDARQLPTDGLSSLNGSVLSELGSEGKEPDSDADQDHTDLTPVAEGVREDEDRRFSRHKDCLPDLDPPEHGGGLLVGREVFPRLRASTDFRISQLPSKCEQELGTARPAKPPPPIPVGRCRGSFGAGVGGFGGGRGREQEVEEEVEVLKDTVQALERELQRKDVLLQQLHVSEFALQQQVQQLRSATFSIARAATSMECMLHEPMNAAIAEETERLTLAYVPVIKSLTAEVDALKEQLRQAEHRSSGD